MRVRRLNPIDEPEWRRLREALWPETAAEGHPSIGDHIARERQLVVVAERPDGRGLAGFAEFSVRSFADGCRAGPVAYLEGWFVDPDTRRQGIGRELLRAGEDWARGNGFRELASDAALDNAVSHRAHAATGFTEVARAVLYRKDL